MIKSQKIYPFFIFLFFLVSCGYTPIFTSQNVNFKIVKYEISGNEDIANDFVKRISRSQSNETNDANEIFLSVDANLSKTSAIKDSTGKILTYKLDMVITAVVKRMGEDKILYADTLESSLNFDAQDQISDTNQLEKTVKDNLLRKISTDLILRINQFIAQ